MTNAKAAFDAMIAGFEAEIRREDRKEARRAMKARIRLLRTI